MKEPNLRKKIAEGYAYKTETIAALSKQLMKLIDELLKTTGHASCWQRRSIKQRKREAKAIKEVAKSLYEVVNAW